MSASPAATHRLHEVLLGYLLAPHVTVWPGGDGLTIEDALYGYLEAVALGQVPSCDELVALHPDLAADLRAFFALASPLPVG
jgi:hypothetical protein